MMAPAQIRHLVAEGVPRVLAALTIPAATDYVVAQLCDLYGLPKKGPEARALAVELLRRKDDFGGRPSSLTFQRYGKTLHRILWPATSLPAAGADPWTIPPLEPIPGRVVALTEWLKAHPEDPRASVVLEVMAEAGAAV